MALSTYAELQASVAAWLARPDLSPVIPDFIRLAEARLSRELRVQQMIVLAPGTLLAGSFPQPDRFLEVASLVFTGSPRVAAAYRAPEQFFALDALNQTSGSPTVVTVSEGLIYVGPVPDSVTGASYELRYYAELPPLSDSVTTNWLLAKSPDTYLFAALVSAEPYLKNDERFNTWKSQCDLAVAQLMGNDRRLKAKGMLQRARTA